MYQMSIHFYQRWSHHWHYKRGCKRYKRQRTYLSFFLAREAVFLRMTLNILGEKCILWWFLGDTDKFCLLWWQWYIDWALKKKNNNRRRHWQTKYQFLKIMNLLIFKKDKIKQWNTKKDCLWLVFYSDLE